MAWSVDGLPTPDDVLLDVCQRQLARQTALRGKQVAVLEPAAYGSHTDVSEAWAAGVLAVGVGPAAGDSPEGQERPQAL